MHIKHVHAPTDMRMTSHPKNTMNSHYINLPGKRHGTAGLWALFLVLCTLGFGISANAGTTFEAISKVLDTAQESCPNGAIDPGETNVVTFTFKNKSGAEIKDVKVALRSQINNVGFALDGKKTVGTVANDATFAVSFKFRADGTCAGTLQPRFAIEGTQGGVAFSDTDVTTTPEKFDFQLGPTLSTDYSFANTASITINDFKATSLADKAKDNGRASTYPSTIAVAGVPNAIGRTGERVRNVTVTLNNVTHGYSPDIGAVLVGPKGHTITLMRNTGGRVSGGNASISGVNLTFDSNASANLSLAGQLTTGTYKPTDNATGLLIALGGDQAPTGAYGTDLAVVRGPAVGAAAVQGDVDAINPNGDWKLYIVDGSQGDAGVVADGWSLKFTTTKVVCCNAGATSPTLTQGSGAAAIPSMSDVTINEDNVFQTDAVDTNKQNSNGHNHSKIGTNTDGTSGLTGSLPSVRLADLESTGDALATGFSRVSGNESLIKSSNIKLIKGTTNTDGTDSQRKFVDYTLDFKPEPNANGTTTVTLTVTDGNGLSSSLAFNLIVKSVNDVPTMPTFPRNQAVNRGTATPDLPITLGDLDHSVDGLVVTGVALDLNSDGTEAATKSVVPDSNIFFTGTGANRTVRVVPAVLGTSGSNGKAVVKVTATDGSNSTTKNFTIDFSAGPNDPTMSPISALTIEEDKNATGIGFTLRSGTSTPPDSLQLAVSIQTSSAWSSTPGNAPTAKSGSDLFPGGSVVFSGTGTERTMSVTPAAGMYGTATIRVTVTDNGVSPAKTFLNDFAVSVTEINQAPTFSAISAVNIDENSATSALTFTLGDRETPTVNFSNQAGNPSITATSSNTGLVPDTVSNGTTPGILVAGTGASRTVKVVPTANGVGKATITLTATDSGTLGMTVGGPIAGATVAAGTSQFIVTVNGINNAPTIAQVQSTVDGVTTTTAFGAADAVITAVTIPEGTATAGGSSVQPTPNNTSVIRVVEQVILLDQIGPGFSNEYDQSVTVTVASDNQTLLPNGNIRVGNTTGNTDTNPTVGFSVGTVTATRNFYYRPVLNQHGEAVITMTLTDNGGADRGGVATTVRKFKIVVSPINDFPSLSAITGPAGIQSNKQGVSVAIAATDKETSTPRLIVTATSDSQAIVANSKLTPDASNTRIAVVPEANAAGTATITVVVTDRGPSDNDTASGADNTTTSVLARHSDTKTFTVTFGNVTVNNAPVIVDINGLATASTVIISEEGVATATITLSQADSNGGIGTADGTPVLGVTTVPVLNNLTLRATSDNTSVVPNANILFGGTGANRTVAVIPAKEGFGNVNISITAQDSSGLASVSKTLPISIRFVQNAPTISVTKADNSGTDANKGWNGALTTLTANENTTVDDPKTGSKKIEIKVRDAFLETPSAQVTVTATSSDTGLLPNANIVIAALDTPTDPYGEQTRTLTITPVASKNGLTTITLTPKDSDNTSGTAVTFILNIQQVNDVPTITQVSNMTISQDAGAQTISLSGIGKGPEEGSQAITEVSAIEHKAGITADFATTSSGILQNVSIVPVVSGAAPLAGTTATLTFGTVSNKFGTATIRVTVKDDGGTSRGGVDTKVMSFNVTVNQINATPTINPITDQTINPQTASTVGPIAVTISDTETAASQLVLSFATDNTVLLPAGTITELTSGVSGGPNRGLVLTPAKLAPGSTNTVANITVTVTDKGNSSGGDIKTAFRTFKLTVIPTLVPTISPMTYNGAEVNPTVGISSRVNTDTDIISFGVADTQTSPASLITVTATSDNQTVLPNGGFQFAPVDSANPSLRRLIITPASNQSGSANVTITATDKDTQFGATANNSATTVFKVTVLGELPTITSIAAQTVPLGGKAGPLAFTVDSRQTRPGFLTVTASSSDKTFLPDAAVVLGGSGNNRTITVGPVANTNGNSTVTVTVADLQSQSSTTTFLVTTPVVANDAPTITAIANQSTDVNKATTIISFTIADKETAADQLTVSAAASNTTLVPAGNIFLGGTGANRTIFVNPGTDKEGTSIITIKITDGGTQGSAAKSAETSFTLTVQANQAPTITSVTSQTVEKNNAATVSVTISDMETAVASLNVAGSSGNTTLVPNANIALSGTGATRTVTVSPAANQVGTASITLTVTDGGGKTATTSFSLTVRQSGGVRGDFSGDGKPDLIFQDPDGFLAAWVMNGTSLDSAGFTVPSNVGDTNYRIVGSGDFNGDGSEDILFQHTDGTLAVWYMNGTSQIDAVLINPSNPGDRNWRVAAVGDINKDGKVDLVFQHTNGDLAVWYMNGLNLSSGALLNPSNPGDSKWRVVGLGDLNADGKLDLIFQHTDGTLATWYLDGIKMTSAAVLDPSTPGDAKWRVVATAQLSAPFSATLSGAAERPTPVTTAATGSAKLSLLGTSLTYTVTYSGLSGSAVAGHIHSPATSEQAAGVSIPFSNVTGVSGTLTGTVGITEAQAANIRDGLSYVNIHTAANPGGEIRGQIVKDASLAGKVDLIFQHTDGTLAVWFLNGVKLSSAQLLSPSNSGATWRVVAPK